MSKLPAPCVIAFTDGMPADELVAMAQRLEAMAYDSLWVPEFFGRAPYATAAFLLARTETLRIATGIANVYSHDAIVAAQNRYALAELSGGRFVLGLGVSHPPMAEMHGLEWQAPVPKMRQYLKTLLATEPQAPPPPEPAPIWIAAHAKGLQAVAREYCDGINTYLMPPEHTRASRERIGSELRMNVVLPCCLTEDAELARKLGRKGLSIYMPLPAYRNQWKAWGFEDADFENGGSDRLIDSAIAWGSESAIRERMSAHIEAGASSIAISAYNPAGKGPDWKLLEAMAP